MPIGFDTFLFGMLPQGDVEGVASIETQIETRCGTQSLMIDDAKHNDRPSTLVSASASATQVTESNLQAFSAAHVLPNGTSILIRAVRPDDKERLRAAFDELERASIYTRFFGYKKALTEAELEQATNVDFDRIVALWATVGSGGAEIIIGGGRYVRNTEPASRPSATLTSRSPSIVSAVVRGRAPLPDATSLLRRVGEVSAGVALASPGRHPSAPPVTGRSSTGLPRRSPLRHRRRSWGRSRPPPG